MQRFYKGDTVAVGEGHFRVLKVHHDYLLAVRGGKRYVVDPKVCRLVHRPILNRLLALL